MLRFHYRSECKREKENKQKKKKTHLFKIENLVSGARRLEMEFRIVLPCSSDDFASRFHVAFLQAALQSKGRVRMVDKTEPFEDEDASDTRLEEGFKRGYRVSMNLPAMLSVLLGSLGGGSFWFDVEEKVCFPFSKARWTCHALSVELEWSTMVLEDRGQHVNALGVDGERSIETIDLCSEVAVTGCCFEDEACHVEPFDKQACDPVCCVYVFVACPKVSSWAQSRVATWLVREPLVALCRRVVSSNWKQEDWAILEDKLISSGPSVSPPVRAKRVVELDGLDAELAAEVRLVRTSQASVSPPMRVKKVEDLAGSQKKVLGLYVHKRCTGFDEELAEEIVKTKGPPARDVDDVSLLLQESSSVPPVPTREDEDSVILDEVVLSDSSPTPVRSSSPPARPLPVLSASLPAIVNLAALPPPPILPSEVRATSPRSSLVLASSELPVSLSSPRPSDCESPRVPIPPLSRKSAGDVRASTSPRNKKVVSPRTLGRSFKAPDASKSESPSPPPPPPPPVPSVSPRSASSTLPAGAQPPNLQTSPRLRSSTVLEEDLVAQAQRLKASPPTSPRPASPGNDVYDLLYRRAQELRKSVARGGDEEDNNDDDDW
jgi:hypothetical protein